MEYYLLILFILPLVLAQNISQPDLTAYSKHRQKRSLTYAGGGTLKLVIGPVIPIVLGDPIPWRSLVCLYNLQGGHYTLPSEPLYPWDRWENRLLQERKLHENDQSQIIAYKVIVNYLNAKGHDGVACLSRLICENAQIDQHIGIFAQVVNVLLTPGKHITDVKYKDAYLSGRHGIDCEKTYLSCPTGSTPIDEYLKDFQNYIQ